MRFAALLVAAGLSVISAVAQTVPVIVADLYVIRDRAVTLDTDLHAFPTSGGTVAQLVTLHNDAQTLISTINIATSHVQATTPGPISVGDANIIVGILQNQIVPVFQDIIQLLVAKKQYFGEVSPQYLDIFKADLIGLRSAVYAYLNALIAIFPIVIQPQVVSFRNALDASFAAAISGWGSAA